jgi:hypothetical protein
MKTLRALLSATLVAATFSVALAKLPPPPPMDSKAKAAAEGKAAKDAAAASQAKSQLAKVEARVVARYIAEQKAKGIIVTPQIEPTAAAASGTVKGPSSQPKKRHRALPDQEIVDR